MNAISKPKLLVTASTFPRSFSDTEPRFVFDLCQILKSTFDITVVAPLAPDIAAKEDMDGIQVIRYRYAPFRKMETLAYPGSIISRIKEKPTRILLAPLLVFGLYRTIKRLLKNEPFDLVQAHWLIPQGVIQSFFNKKTHPPYVITSHGGDIFSLNRFPISRFKQNALKNASGITVVSRITKEFLSSKYALNESPKVISMGCFTKKFDSSLYSKEYFSKLGIDGLIVLFVGRLVEIKGIEYLIKALSCPILENNDFTLAIVGEGPLKSSLESLSDELNLDEKIVFLGKKTHEELLEIYSSSDVFCAPSITLPNGIQEGFPVVVIEAASCGLPVITTKRGLDEAVIDGKTGFVVEEKSPEQIAEALSKLLNSKEMRQEFGNNGKEHAKQYDWEVIGKRYSEFLQSIRVSSP